MNSSELEVQVTHKPNIFISHSHKDQIYARKILGWLEKVGFTPWASFEECSDLYRMEIDNALLKCDVFLLIASKNSFASVEVRRELTTAGSLSKPISYYKLDESSHNREGFLTLLSEKQYVQASRHNLELDKLAVNVYEAFDGNKDADRKQARDGMIANCLAVENDNYLQWKEKLWSLRLDPSNNARKLSSFDRDILQQEAYRLGIIVSIDDENQAFSLNKQSFSRDLIGIIAKRRIDKAMLAQIDKKRLECSVSKSLALSILTSRLNKIEYLNHISISKGAEKTDHWLVNEIRNARLQNQNQHNVGITPCNQEKLPVDYTPLKSESFRLKQRLCFLESYIKGASDIKMYVLSLEKVGGSLEFHGIKSMAPFSLSIPGPYDRITTGSDLLRLHRAGFETYVVLRIDRTTEDFNALLEFLARTTGAVRHDINLDGANRISVSPGVTEDFKTDIRDKFSPNTLANQHKETIKTAEEPDAFIYVLAGIAGVILISAAIARSFYNAVVSLFLGHL
jgi:hypothetical protein